MSEKQKQLKNNEPKKKDQNESIVDKIWDLFSSMKTGLVLLALVTVAAILGTIIPQYSTDPEAAEATNQLFKSLGLTNLYSSTWFIFLLGLLCLNLIVCSIQRFDGIYKKAFRPTPPKVAAQIPNKLKEEITGNITPEKVESILHKEGFKIRAEQTDAQWSFAGVKRRWGYWGSLITHLAFVVIAIGGLIGSLYGVKGFLAAGSGETVNIQDIQITKGVIDEEFSVRINSAEERFAENNQRDNWYTNLSIIKDGNVVAEGTLSVNHPFEYEGYTFYQSTFSSGAQLEVSTGDKASSFVLKNGGYIQIPHVDTEKEHYLVIGAMKTEAGEEAILIQIYEGMDASHPFQQSTMKPGDTINIQDKYSITFKGITGYTGLQVKKDPGVSVVWVGFALGMIGLLLSFYWKPTAIYGILTRTNDQNAVITLGTSTGKVADRSVQEFNKVVNQLKA